MTDKQMNKHEKKAALDKAFSEVFNNPPSTLKKGQSKEKRHKQMVAIAMSKAGQSKRD